VCVGVCVCVCVCLCVYMLLLMSLRTTRDAAPLLSAPAARSAWTTRLSGV